MGHIYRNHSCSGFPSAIFLQNRRQLHTDVLYTYLNISLQKRNVGTGSFYTYDVLSNCSVSMIYNVTNIKLIDLILLKEILSFDIQMVYIGFRGEKILSKY